MLLPRAEHTEAKIGLKFEFPACRCQILPSPGILAFSYAIWAILYVLKILNANLIKGNKHRMISMWSILTEFLIGLHTE